MNAKPIGWITSESLHRLLFGGNRSHGTVPVHFSKSGVANIPLYAARAPVKKGSKA